VVRSVEAVVVGGGITGASLRLHLERAGHEVLLLESRELAAGATGRNAGFLIQGVAENYESAVQRYGRAQAADLWRFTRACHEELAAALAESDVEYRRCGSWTAAASAAEAAELRRSETMLREDGFEVRWHESVASLPPGYHGALLNPTDAEIDSGAAVRALAMMGAGEVATGAEVTSFEARPGAVVVGSSRGEIHARRVFIATNAWAGRLVPGAPIEPVRGQALLTEPISALVADRCVYADRGFQYWRQRRDGALLVGGWRNVAMSQEVGFDETPTEAVQGHLDAHLARLRVDAPVARRWAGVMGFTPDHLPLVGAAPSAPGVFLCAGYSGHGMGFAFRAARLLVESLAGGEPLPAWMSPARFASKPVGQELQREGQTQVP